VLLRSVARPDLGGKAESWAALHTRSLRRLVDRPARLTVMPAHAASLDEADARGVFAATLAEIRAANDSVRALVRETDERFARSMLESLPAFLPEYVEIKRVNAGLATPSDDDAAALELGKNLCALGDAGGGRA
jgi:hypothetical protein